MNSLHTYQSYLPAASVLLRRDLLEGPDDGTVLRERVRDRKLCCLHGCVLGDYCHGVGSWIGAGSVGASTGEVVRRQAAIPSWAVRVIVSLGLCAGKPNAGLGISPAHLFLSTARTPVPDRLSTISTTKTGAELQL